MAVRRTRQGNHNKQHHGKMELMKKLFGALLCNCLNCDSTAMVTYSFHYCINLWPFYGHATCSIDSAESLEVGCRQSGRQTWTEEVANLQYRSPRIIMTGSRVFRKAQNGSATFYRHVKVHFTRNKRPSLLVARSCLMPFMAVIKYPRPP